MICLLLGLSVLSIGCDSSSSSASALDQPKNQMEGLNRMRDSMQKHAQEAKSKAAQHK
jgi:hypothetical protein